MNVLGYANVAWAILRSASWMTRDALARGAGFGAIVIAAFVLAIVVVTGGSSYTIYAEFEDAGQLVNGDLVVIAGHPVGSTGTPKLSQNGLAVIPLKISDSSITPLHLGTVATIGQLSLTGVSNRFVSLSPGTDNATLASGSVLPLTQTRGIVDLDSVLDSLTPQVRSYLVNLIKSGAFLSSGKTPEQLSQALYYLNPALSQTAELGSQIASDRFDLSRLLSSTAQVSSALAGRDPQLGSAVSNTATTLTELASERSALEDSLARAPGVLKQGTGVLTDANYALGVANPVVADLRPVAPKLAMLLADVLPAAANAIPTIKGVQALIPGASEALKKLPPVVNVAVPAVNSLGEALPGVTPMLSGLRPYTPEVVSGFFGSLGGDDAGYYDANGHYVRVSIQVAPTSSGGLLSLLNPILSELPPFDGTRERLFARCPGGAVGPATSGGNPWTNLDTLPGAGNVCDPADDQP